MHETIELIYLQAAKYGHRDTCAVLLRAGISKDARTKVDKTPVHIASQEGHSDVLELLLKNGCDVEAVDMVRCFTQIFQWEGFISAVCWGA